MLSYPVKLQQDDNDTLAVSFPDFPEAHTFGVDKDDAMKRAQSALVTIVDEYVKRWRAIPSPSAGRTRVALPALTAAKVLLYTLMQRDEITKAELARRLQWHPPQVDRLFDVFHQSRLDQLEQAFNALGQQLVVTTAESQLECTNKPAAADRFKLGSTLGLKGTVLRRSEKVTTR
jgi:antitoxin HicB